MGPSSFSTLIPFGIKRNVIVPGSPDGPVICIHLVTAQKVILIVFPEETIAEGTYSNVTWFTIITNSIDVKRQAAHELADILDSGSRPHGGPDLVDFLMVVPFGWLQLGLFLVPGFQPAICIVMDPSLFMALGGVHIQLDAKIVFKQLRNTIVSAFQFVLHLFTCEIRKIFIWPIQVAYFQCVGGCHAKQSQCY
jgi:hypothetical protein